MPQQHPNKPPFGLLLTLPVLRPELVDLQAVINEALTKFVNSGARDEALKRHSGDASFPKGKC
ncbi:hypothetical protein [Alteromonas sp. MTD1]|uniref:hypothetical protein n=1 Tax=Alteromonas sp. MTD1 TaxID=3057962 RepID=UPI0036F2DDD4